MGWLSKKTFIIKVSRKIEIIAMFTAVDTQEFLFVSAWKIQ